MIVLRNLKIASEEMKYYFYDAVYKKKKSWFLFNCHGYSNGEMTMTFPDGECEIRPAYIRKFIYLRYGIDMPINEPVFISTCYPKSVFEKNKDELAKYNIFLLSKDSDEEMFVIYIDKYAKMGYYEGEKVKSDSLTMLIGKDSEFKSEPVLARKYIYDYVWRRNKK